jgi:hypothetical protein
MAKGLTQRTTLAFNGLDLCRLKLDVAGYVPKLPKAAICIATQQKLACHHNSQTVNRIRVDRYQHSIERGSGLSCQSAQVGSAATGGRERCDRVDYRVLMRGHMSYFPPLNILLNALELSETDLSNSHVTIGTESFKNLVALFLQYTEVDEHWYRERYPDVGAAILARQYPSSKVHFVLSGYFERRCPGAVSFDAAWYVDNYRDIAEAFKTRAPEEVRDHFVSSGYFEGRAGNSKDFVAAEAWRNKKMPQAL